MATTFNLVKKTKVNYENRDCDVYTYQADDDVITFIYSLSGFIFFKDTTAEDDLRDEVTDAFLEACRLAYGDKEVFAKNISVLTV